MITYLMIILCFLLFPFSLSLSLHLRRPKDDYVDTIDCKNLNQHLTPYIDEIINVIQEQGKFLDGKSNFNSVEGYKIVRNDIKKHLPEVYEIIERYVRSIKVDNMNMANCDNEKYCWFLRLYNKEGHYLDWHFDNNFTTGKRKTYVCNIYVSDENESHFLVKNKNNITRVITSKNGEGVLYNGSDVKHAISSQIKNGVRISLIVPFYENDKLTIIGKWRMWARDIMYSILKL